MKKPSDRRLIENEILARRQNSRFKQAMKKYFMAGGKVSDTVLDFSCECSDLNCEERVKLTIKEYEAIHRRKDRFILKKNHKTPAVEKTVADKDSYAIVEKYALEPQAS